MDPPSSFPASFNQKLSSFLPSILGTQNVGVCLVFWSKSGWFQTWVSPFLFCGWNEGDKNLIQSHCMFINIIYFICCCEIEEDGANTPDLAILWHTLSSWKLLLKRSSSALRLVLTTSLCSPLCDLFILTLGHDIGVVWRRVILIPSSVRCDIAYTCETCLR